MISRQLLNETRHEDDQHDLLLLRHVGQAVMRHRRANNLAVADLSALSGLSGNVIADLEGGTHDIDLAGLSSIAAALGVSALDLVDMSR